MAAVDLGRDAPFHRFDVIYQRIMEGLRTEHFQELLAFEFILQEWLFNVEKEVLWSMRLDPWQHDHRAHMATIVEAHLEQQLAALAIHDASFAQALRSYYAAAQANNDSVATAAANWLKGIPTASACLQQDLGIRGGVAQDNPLIFSGRWPRSSSIWAMLGY